MGTVKIKKAMKTYLCLFLILATASARRGGGGGKPSPSTAAPTEAPTAAYYEWDSLDPYFGHSDQSKQYHYHAVPNGWSSANDPAACEHIGYMHDGGKLYGFCGDVDSCYVQTSSGDATNESDYTYTNDANCQLDECNMYNLNGEMVYVMTPSWPYVPPCMKGTVSKAYGFTP